MNKERLMKILLAPLVSEKSTQMADASRHFAFKVAPDASKPEIKAAVSELFKVEVDSVRVLNVKGKKKRHGAIMGRRADWKKAYVKLKPGNDIDFGAGA
ncbi:MAG: 50S ribosomal protein L23 [Gammaproteobacteria bacterium SHHR-1]|uniref:50S ribosomal protein L23 n=1 Tax=Magnetovirga frankeli TaxID=947516 RepID=UPI00129364D4|nr:50S ribosomal protein L23 [gamma proteobacterium SS-5]